MYGDSPLIKDGMGDLGLVPGASSAISSTVSASVNYAVASATAGYLVPLTFGSMAGPIGAIIGAIVSVIMAIFGGGKKPKVPVFGMTIVVHGRAKTERPLTIDLIEAGTNFIPISGNIPGEKNYTRSFIGFTSGGVPQSHGALAGAVPQIIQKQNELFGPFYEIWNRLSSELQTKIGNRPICCWPTPETLMGSKSYYWTIALPPDYNAWILSNKSSIEAAATEGYGEISRFLGGTLDIFKEDITADLSRPSLSNITENLTNPSSPVFWIAIAGGAYLLTR